ncbi:Rha family transcriptional regulator [Campylobacter jejuni]|nr:Rha family transcriptional regulator [Campylobacter jejuni]
MSNKVIINKQEVQFGTQGNQVFCTSLDIAKVFGKQHKHILELIGEKFNNNEIKNFCEPNFRLSFKTRKIEGFRGKERKYPYYQLTKDGFSLLAMGFTGKKALQFKIAFINAFNEMEKLLQKEILAHSKTGRGEQGQLRREFNDRDFLRPANQTIPQKDKPKIMDGI